MQSIFMKIQDLPMIAYLVSSVPYKTYLYFIVGLISGFLSTLRFILDSDEYHNAVCWDDTGTVFCIKDQEWLVDVILPKFFRHKNFANGFHKVNAVNIVPPLHANVPCFSHKYFLRGEPSLDVNIRRKCYQEKSPPPLTRNEETVTYADVIRVVMRTNEQLNEITKRVSKLEKEMVDAKKYMPNWCITTFLQLLTAASQKQGTVDLFHLLHMLTQTQYKANRQNSNGKSVPYVPIVKSQTPKNGLRVNTISQNKRKQQLNSVESTPPVVVNDAMPSVAGSTNTMTTTSLPTSAEDASEPFAVCTAPAYTDAIMTYNSEINVDNLGNVSLDDGCLNPLPPPPPPQPLQQQQQQQQQQPQTQQHPTGDSMITYPCTWDLPEFDDISANFLTDDNDPFTNMEFDYYGGMNWRTESADLITFTGGDRVQRVHSASSTSSFSSCIDENDKNSALNNTMEFGQWIMSNNGIDDAEENNSNSNNMLFCPKELTLAEPDALNSQIDDMFFNNLTIPQYHPLAIETDHHYSLSGNYDFSLTYPTYQEIEFPNNNLSTVQEVSTASNLQPSGTQLAPLNEPNGGGMENNTVFKPLTMNSELMQDDMHLSDAYNDMLNTPKLDELSHEDLIAEFLLPMTHDDSETLSKECDTMICVPQPSFVSEQPMAILQSDVQNVEMPLADNNTLNNGDQSSLNSANLSSMLLTVPSSTTIQPGDESQLPLIGPENGSQKEENHINVSSSILGRRSSTKPDVPCNDAFQSSNVKSRKRSKSLILNKQQIQTSGKNSCDTAAANTAAAAAAAAAAATGGGGGGGEKKNDGKAASCLKMFNLTDAKTGKKITCRVIRR
ncbi:Heat shock factor protein 3 [Trichinella pseudospiralis]|uniref:Heat shock factor protein 3 n=1 Tax=Trichinella pseudospiralis TaxID=6337 RepID=A0A0V1EU30_TRIPS|nr:Heat shock factor protein 3 [Trichinella pseudospiralis]